MQVFLDHNSTTPPLAEVLARMDECYRRAYANPASQHAAGRRARRIVEDARDEITLMLGANVQGRQPDRLIFTSGGTESNNLALFGLASKTAGRLIISAIEHPSVVGPAEFLARSGWRLQRLAVDQRGIAKVDESALDGPTPALATLMLGNNETGVLQPVQEMARLCNERGIPLHTDAVQVVGKLPVNFQRLGAATLAFSAHKFHGPRGVGGLLVRGDIELQPLLYGGFQQGGLRPGTEPVALIAGMHKALEIWQVEMEQRMQRMTALRDRLEASIRARVPDTIINGFEAERLPHTSNVSFPGLDRRALSMALDLEGVACSTGSACASGSSEPSPVLVAMGLPAEVVAGSLRFSIGATTSEAEIDTAVECLVNVVDRLQTRSKESANLR